MKKVSYFYGLATLLFFTTCKHEDALFPYTQQGLNRASFMVDDKAYKIDDVSYGDNMYFSYYSNDSNLYGVLLYKHSNFGVYFYLNDIVFELGRINFKPGRNAIFIDGSDYKYIATKGNINIKYIDSTNKYKRIIAGEFEFEAWNSTLNKTIHISRGNFDSEYSYRK